MMKAKYTSKIPLLLTPEMKAKVQEIAKSQGTSATEVIRKCVQKVLKLKGN